MRAASIEIAQTKFIENPAQVAPREDYDVIQAFASGTTNEPLANRVLQGGLNRRSHYLNASTLRHALKFCPELAVIVANDELRSLAERRDVAKDKKGLPAPEGDVSLRELPFEPDSILGQPLLEDVE